MAATDGTDKKNDATDSARIGWAFLSQYYSFLNKDPARLHCFYTKRSTLIHGTEGEDSVPCYGQQEIHAKIMSLKLDDCKVYISNVDSQSSAEGGIIVQVLGELSNANGPWRKFVQTFFLAEQPNGYFVLNDICRYIKEEGDESPETPTPAVQHEAVQNAAPASVQSILFDDKATLFTNENRDEAQPQAEAEQAHGDDTFTFHSSRDFTPATTNGTSSEEAPEATELEHTDATADAPEASEPTEAAETRPAVEESAPAQPEETETPVPVETPAAEQATAEQPQASESASTPTSEPASAAAPAPAAPSAAPTPKSWASLAASNSTKWGRLSNEAKGVSSAASSAPSPAVERAPAPAAAPSASTAQPQFVESVMAIRTPSCFVKGVIETVSEQALKDTLISRFGPLKEVDIVRNKACAFIEFEKLDHARRAIQTSLRQAEGGEGGIMITVDPATGAQTRINIVERKPHDQRPKRADGATRGGRGGSSGGTGGRGGARGGRIGTSARGGAAAK
ncbi:hypothetical protein NBRC10512_005727 [Rhodotorula toruloides]|uniref:RHTO0S21e00298g1_1 n=2 Tax=Rhodotorula toruloides TaxID=5286 RepID=A0A061BP53_RHOTO|nr:RAN protein binding protein [Rhodotorula toruloides NP11]EMS20876.1 RAN protein binding protein [Rhodotorula toruloides NP11]CDR48855.1 RHTO0S21e00298g1_1 [Rhodotorula toruloides]